MGIIATIANVETVRMSERIRFGLAPPRAQGRKIGRPRAVYPVEPGQIAQERAQGASWGSLASKYQLPRTSVRRLYKKSLVKIGPGKGKDGGRDWPCRNHLVLARNGGGLCVMPLLLFHPAMSKSAPATSKTRGVR